MNTWTRYSSESRISMLSAWPLVVCIAAALPYSFLSTALVLPYLLLVTSVLLLLWTAGHTLLHKDRFAIDFSYNRMLVLMIIYVLYLCATPWIHKGIMTGFPTNKYLVLTLAYMSVYLQAVILFRADIVIFRVFSLCMTMLAIVFALQFYYITYFSEQGYDGRGLLFGRHLLAMFLVLVAYLLLHGPLFAKRTSWIIVGLLMVTVLLCSSRTVILSLLVSASVVTLLYRPEWLRAHYCYSW